jgi:putative ABC transport system permease protein
VLTATTARKYFGNENPLGKSMILEGKQAATVTGVMPDVPDNSHFKFDLLVSFTTLSKIFAPGIDDQWGNFGSYTYVLLKPHVSAATLERKIPALVEKKIGTFMKENNMYYTYFLEPLTNVYLRSKRDAPETGNLTNIYIFSIVAAFILLIACINFMNLVIARSAERAREVGIRKVVGAMRRQLTVQFLSESILLSFLAFLLAGILCEVLLPFFNNFSGKIIAHRLITDGTYWLTLLGLVVLVGLVAGFYPALVLSRFMPVSVLKGRFVNSANGLLLRKTLVVVQFVISVGLMVGTLVASRQLHFMRSRQLGFQKEQMLMVSLGDREFMAKNAQALRGQIAVMPGVQSVALSSHTPGGGNMGAATAIENRNGEMQTTNMALYSVDFDFIPHYGIKMAAGRAFSPQFSTDSTEALVINEAAANAMGYSSAEQAVGRRFDQWGRKGRIIGVVKNFHISSLKEKIAPLTMRINPEDFRLFALKVKAENTPATIAALGRLWKSAVPQRPLDYFFLDEAFDKQYRAEERFGQLFLYFSGLAVFIACLGLFGLTAYTTAQRTKEIGVRKVLGASVGSIVALLSQDFLRLVMVAILIASPIAWWAMNKWLEDFEYRTTVEWWVFALAGLLALGIAILTVSYQSIKAALTDPVQSLRSE